MEVLHGAKLNKLVNSYNLIRPKLTRFNFYIKRCSICYIKTYIRV